MDPRRADPREGRPQGGWTPGRAGPRQDCGVRIWEGWVMLPGASDARAAGHLDPTVWTDGHLPGQG